MQHPSGSKVYGMRITSVNFYEAIVQIIINAMMNMNECID
jgi:hypothetical protein